MNRILSTLTIFVAGTVAASAAPITAASQTVTSAAAQVLQPVLGVATPEPGTIGMMVVGAGLLALKLRRR